MIETTELAELALSEIEDIRSLRAAVIVLEANGRVRLWNVAAHPIFGVSVGDATNKNFADIARRRLGASVDGVLGALAAQRPLRTLADGGALAVSVLPDPTGNVIVVRSTSPALPS